MGSLLSDGHHIVISGADAELRWGYRRVAQLRDVTLERHASTTWTLTATVTSKDDYAVSQRPLVFVIPARHWRWDVLSLQIADGSVTAELRAQV